MKATWKRENSHQLRLTPAFVLSLLLGGRVDPESLNPNEPGDIGDLDEPSLNLIVTEGRRQIDSQAERFKHTTDRAQILLTMSLVVVAFVAAIFGHVVHAHGAREIVGLAFWALAALVTIVGVAAAAAVIVVRADFDTIDTTIISNWNDNVLQRLASAYSNAVIVGETTIGARVTAFRVATRLVCWGAILTAVAFVIVAA